MECVLFKTVVTFLAIYALMDIFSRLFACFLSKKRKTETVIVISVKNQEDNLEYIIRTVMWNFLSNKRGGVMPAILIVDMGSDDDTPVIAAKLCEDYSFIYYTTSEKYDEFKNQLSGE